tara:strand:- start:4438 stop:4872 length:435 start_codon:yes stop_codon:yes gene_type:complete
MVVQLARPSDEEQLKNLQAVRFQPNPGPMQAQQPGVMETIASTAGSAAAGKLGEAAAGKLMSGSLFGGSGAAATGGMGALGALGTAVPYVGLGLLAGKAFGLFNHGGMVPEMMMGPLSKIRYKRGGGEVSEEIEVTYGPLAKGA